jgi:predicted outer membrane repeat protein
MHNLLDQSTIVSPEPDTDSSHLKSKKHFALSSLVLILTLVLIAFSLMWLSAPAAQASVSLKPIKDNLQLAPLSATLTVTSTDDSGPGTLRDALAAASNGDTINFNLPNNSVIVLTSGELAVNTSVTIDGSTATNLSVSGDNASRVFNVSVPATFIGFTIMNGNADINFGGGLSTSDAITLTHVTFISNTAGAGGGAYAAGAATLNGGLFQNNTGDNGGGLYAGSTLVLTGTQFISNTAAAGGGVAVYGAATLNGGLFLSNTVTGLGVGGGLYANSTLVLTDTQFLSNTAVFGGGIEGYGAVTLNGALFQNNTASNVGGGLYAVSTLVLTGTQFISNTAAVGGGALFLYDATTQRVVNALFARNTSSLGADLFSKGNVAILHSTFANPTSGNGVAIYIYTGTLGITNTIIANHTTGIEKNVGTVYADYNLFYGNTTDISGTIAGGTHDVIGNPNFVDPANDDYHLQSGSAAIDKGIDAGLTTDIDGQLRPFCGRFDIGYDEYQTCNIYLPLAMKNF